MLNALVSLLVTDTDFKRIIGMRKPRLSCFFLAKTQKRFSLKHGVDLHYPRMVYSDYLTSLKRQNLKILPVPIPRWYGVR